MDKRTEKHLLTPEETERWLTDSDWRMRSVWAGRKDITPTPEQIERGLQDEDRWVRLAFSTRADFVPTPEQIKRGLQDTDAEVREVWEKRHALILESAISEEDDTSWSI